MFVITMYTLAGRKSPRLQPCLPQFVTVPKVNAAVLTELFLLRRLGVLDEVGIPDLSLNFTQEICW
jgi:hypothetical protein